MRIEDELIMLEEDLEHCLSSVMLINEMMTKLKERNKKKNRIKPSISGEMLYELRAKPATAYLVRMIEGLL